jgi:hypothetical protein
MKTEASLEQKALKALVQHGRNNYSVNQGGNLLGSGLFTPVGEAVVARKPRHLVRRANGKKAPTSLSRLS